MIISKRTSRLSIYNCILSITLFREFNIHTSCTFVLTTVVGFNEYLTWDKHTRTAFSNAFFSYESARETRWLLCPSKTLLLGKIY